MRTEQNPPIPEPSGIGDVRGTYAYITKCNDTPFSTIDIL